ncbi:MAG: SRPBCC family protein [Mycobacteriales bacterium]
MINADPTTVFDVLADPAQHSLFDGSGTVKGRMAGPPRLYLGATFAMRMRWGAPYFIRSRVVEYDEDRRIAWRHPLRHIWRYELTPIDGATEVTESFDYAQSPAAPAYERLGITDKNHTSIEATLQQLKVLVESRTTTAR